MAKLRVGLIGARPDQGWAGKSHVPAIGAVESLELATIATRDPASAKAAERAFGVRGYADPFEMIGDASIDLVAVVVKAPEHKALVEAAISSGKAIYCEWPLGRDGLETEQLAAKAAEKGVATCIGLQGRSSPSLVRVKELIAEGRLGRILSTTMVASDLFSTGSVTPANAYMLDAANGATPLSIVGGHTLDALCSTLGEFSCVHSLLRTSRPTVKVDGTDKILDSSLPDQIIVAGEIEKSIPTSVHIRAGHSGDRALAWEIQGEEALLRATSHTYIHWAPLRIEIIDTAGVVEVVKPEEDAFSHLEANDTAAFVNIARHYANFRQAIANETPAIAPFHSAMQRRKMLDDITAKSN